MPFSLFPLNLVEFPGYAGNMSGNVNKNEFPPLVPVAKPSSFIKFTSLTFSPVDIIFESALGNAP